MLRVMDLRAPVPEMKFILTLKLLKIDDSTTEINPGSVDNPSNEDSRARRFLQNPLEIRRLQSFKPISSKNFGGKLHRFIRDFVHMSDYKTIRIKSDS